MPAFGPPGRVLRAPPRSRALTLRTVVLPPGGRGPRVVRCAPNGIALPSLRSCTLAGSPFSDLSYKRGACSVPLAGRTGWDHRSPESEAGSASSLGPGQLIPISQYPATFTRTVRQPKQSFGLTACSREQSTFSPPRELPKRECPLILASRMLGALRSLPWWLTGLAPALARAACASAWAGTVGGAPGRTFLMVGCAHRSPPNLTASPPIARSAKSTTLAALSAVLASSAPGHSLSAHHPPW